MRRLLELLKTLEENSMLEWKKLVSVSEVQYGYPFESSLFSEDSNFIPLIRIRDVKPAKASTYYSGEILEEYVVTKGDILVGMDGEFNLGKWNDRDGLLNQRVLKLTGKKGICLDGYLFHYMGPVFKKIEKQTAGGSVKHLSAKVINALKIPVPSITEQTRIVGILDTFTASIENLKQQIAQRRKQYEHYRDQLLDLEGKEGVEMKAINQVANSFTGLTYKPTDVADSGTLVLRSSNIAEDTLSFTDNVYVLMENIPARVIVKEGDVLICVRNGSKRLVGKCAMISKEAAGMAFGAFMTILRGTNINNKYLFYVWQSEKVKKQYKGDEAMPIAQITAKDFQRIIIPVPTINEQQRIVSILDTFEAGIANLEQQLAQRERQYEYYRNQLLTFE